MGEKIRFTKAIKVGGKKYAENDTGDFSESTVKKLVDENGAAVRTDGDEVEDLGDIEEAD